MDTLPALGELLTRLERAWVPPRPPESDNYTYDATQLQDLLDAIEVLGPAEGRRMVDLGCGIGRTLLLFHLLGWETVGVEVRPQYVAVARGLCSESEIRQAHVLDVEDLDTFDLVMAYRPFIADDDEALFEKHVVSQMRQGSLLFLPGREHIGLGEHLGASVRRV